MSDTRAIFVIDGETAPLGAIAAGAGVGPSGRRPSWSTASDGERHDVARALIAFAELTARAIGLREVRLAAGIVPPDLATSLGYATA